MYNSTLPSTTSTSPCAAEDKTLPSSPQASILYLCRLFSIALAISVTFKENLSKMSYMIESGTGQVRNLFSLPVFKSVIFLNFHIRKFLQMSLLPKISPYA